MTRKGKVGWIFFILLVLLPLLTGLACNRDNDKSLSERWDNDKQNVKKFFDTADQKIGEAAESIECLDSPGGVMAKAFECGEVLKIDD